MFHLESERIPLRLSATRGRSSFPRCAKVSQPVDTAILTAKALVIRRVVYISPPDKSGSIDETSIARYMRQTAFVSLLAHGQGFTLHEGKIDLDNSDHQHT